MNSQKYKSSRVGLRLVGGAIGVLLVIYLLLLLPPTDDPAPQLAAGQPFLWDQDQRWAGLEQQFREARTTGCDDLDTRIASLSADVRNKVDSLQSFLVPVEAPVLDAIEDEMFELAAMVAACPSHLPEYAQLNEQMRGAIKWQSRHWDFRSRQVRQRLYRLLYGSRAALEEVMLQAPPAIAAALLPANAPVQSATPKIVFLGAELHSGDILVSRGGAPTSALIARGNDYPGNFSHIALLHVDPQTNIAAIIESHIERGVAISTLQEYVADKKLRVMVLRLRPDLPALLADPLLPHRAAAMMLTMVQSRHIPYDFEMDYREHGKLFCSEVATAAYEPHGIQLWMGISQISTPGMAAWLAAFGVKHFETQEPSDLEYDPQLSIVAEWRDPETLNQDHVDNAVIDIMLEGAEHGERLEYNHLLLPMSRIAKLYSIVLNQFGAIGPIPEGMSAATALRHTRFTETHRRIKAHTLLLADSFKRERGYLPPYWELIKLARHAKSEIEN